MGACVKRIVSAEAMIDTSQAHFLLAIIAVSIDDAHTLNSGSSNRVHVC